MVVCCSHWCALLEGLNHLRTLEQLCDVTIKASDGSLSCHSAVLAACSGFLKQQLLDNATDGVIKTPFKLHLVDVAIQFMYTGEAVIDKANGAGLMELSFQWQMESLYDLVVNSVQCHVDLGTVAKYHQLAVDQRHNSLIQLTSRYVRQQFANVDLTCLSFDVMCTILDYDEVNVDTEQKICLQIFDWVTHNGWHEKYYKLIKRIRFENLALEYLNIIKCHPVMQHPKIQARITLAVSYQEHQEKHNKLKNERSWTKRDSDILPVFTPLLSRMQSSKFQQTNQICYISTEQQTDSVERNSIKSSESLVVINKKHELHLYESENDHWTHVLNAPDWMDEGTAVCVISSFESTNITTMSNNEMNAFEQHRAPCPKLTTGKSFDLLDAFVFHDDDVPDLNEDPEKVAVEENLEPRKPKVAKMNTNSNCVITVGADDKHNGKYGILLNFTNKSCLPLPSLPVAVRDAGLVSTESVLYLVGGWMYDNDKWTLSNVVYRLNISNIANEWEVLSPLSHPVSEPIVLINKNKIFVMGGVAAKCSASKHTQVYDLESQTCVEVKEMPHGCRTSFDCGVVYRGAIWMITPTSVMRYNAKEDQWTFQKYSKLGESPKAVVYQDQILANVEDVGSRKPMIYFYNNIDNQWHREEFITTNELLHFACITRST